MRLLTIEQAAEVLAVHPNTVRSLLPKIGAVDLSQGGKKRLLCIPESNLERYVRDCTITRPERRTTAREWHIERRRERAG